MVHRSNNSMPIHLSNRSQMLLHSQAADCVQLSKHADILPGILLPRHSLWKLAKEERFVCQPSSYRIPANYSIIKLHCLRLLKRLTNRQLTYVITSTKT